LAPGRCRPRRTKTARAQRALERARGKQRVFNALRDAYGRALDWSLKRRWVVGVSVSVRPYEAYYVPANHDPPIFPEDGGPRQEAGTDDLFGDAGNETGFSEEKTLTVP